MESGGVSCQGCERGRRHPLCKTTAASAHRAAPRRLRRRRWVSALTVLAGVLLPLSVDAYSLWNVTSHFLPTGRGDNTVSVLTGAQWRRPRLVVPQSLVVHPAMYVPGDGLLYCPIAKVACAEWRKTMRWMLGISDWESGPIHDTTKNGIPKLADRSAYEVENMLNSDSWLKFAVVRNPQERLLSAFLNKCLGAEWFNCPYMQFMPQRFPDAPRRTKATDQTMLQMIYQDPRGTFADFAEGVRRDVEELGCEVNSHWRPQYCFCGLAEYLDVYYVIPFQNMSALATTVADRLTRPSPQRQRRLHQFVAERFASNHDSPEKQQKAADKKVHFLSSRSQQIVLQVYAKDYELFGQYFDELS